MTASTTAVRFFMGANTPDGFLGFPDDWYHPEDGWRACLIKGGPGTGKSSLMRKVGEAMEAAGAPVEWIHCSSDPGSLDGVRFPEQKRCLLDATAPHILEPHFWGACEDILPLSGCMDSDRLYPQLPEIRRVIAENARLHARCRKYIAAAANLRQNNLRIVLPFTDTEKISRAVTGILRRELPNRPDTPGRCVRRFLSAVTPEGYLTFYDTLQTLCPRIYSIEDDVGYVAHTLMTLLRDKAAADGWETISCPSPLDPARLEHLLLPGAGLGFTLSDACHKVDFPVYRRIHAVRFTRTEELSGKRQLLSFNRRSLRELLNEAVSASAEAKAVHDQIEAIYTPATDFAAVDRLTAATVARFVASVG